MEPGHARAVLDIQKLGQKWVYTLNDGDVPSASMDWRRPDYAEGNLVASGRHTTGQNWLSWDVSGARSRMLQSGGNGGASYKWNGRAINCVNDSGAPTDVNLPMFNAACFSGLNGPIPFI
jgi:hypothetical protein